MVEAPVEEAPKPAPPPEEKKELPGRKDKRAAGMVWSELVAISMPSPKHILEQMKASDANGKSKVSVVELAVAQEAVTAIGAHVRANGWKSSAEIVIEWVEADKCFKVTYKGNQWMTHVNSGQLWPLRGRDIFSPPEGMDVRSAVNKWKSSKPRVRPAEYMG